MHRYRHMLLEHRLPEPIQHNADIPVWYAQEYWGEQNPFNTLVLEV